MKFNELITDLNIWSFIVTSLALLFTVYIFNVSVNGQRKILIRNITRIMRMDIMTIFHDSIMSQEHIIKECDNIYPHTAKLISSLEKLDGKLRVVPSLFIDYDLDSEKKTYKRKEYIHNLFDILKKANIHNIDLLYEWQSFDNNLRKHYKIKIKYIRKFRHLFTISGAKVVFYRRKRVFKYDPDTYVKIKIRRINTYSKFERYLKDTNKEVKLIGKQNELRAGKELLKNLDNITVKYEEDDLPF